jgi:(1->4)-alpha-D-glucan 1-alpha-D-glucosylmutase
MPTLRIPLATYRLQFSGQFRFEQARALVGYFDDLGVTDIYGSPLLQARRGSLHGYDVTNPTHLNADIGTEPEFEALTAELQQHHMGLLLDIVPNHMAAGSENPWWMDVLEDGPGSAYAAFFDIDWYPPRTITRNKVLLPILGRAYAEALENQELNLMFEQAGFFIYYFDTKLPVAPKSYLLVLQHRIDELRNQLGDDHQAFRELRGILATVTSLPERSTLSNEMAGERRLQREAIKERVWNLYQNSPEVRDFLDENVRVFNGRKREPASFVFLDRLLAEQAYLLSYWLSANDEINYRRFFTITDLVGVRVEDPLVFEATHAVVLRLIEKGLVTGLRIDHVDGLRDPLGYLRRLQERVAGSIAVNHHPPFFVLVEKILARGEALPLEWPICGATGYAFLNAVNGLFLDPGGCTKLEQTYQSFTGARVCYPDLVYEKKKEVMANLLRVEMRSLGHYLALLAERDRYGRDLPRADLAQALTETTACLPVYRTYVRGFPLRSEERRPYIVKALEAARRRNSRLRPECFDFVSDVLLLRERPHVLPEQREARLAFVMRWQQFTGPITAKAVEDSALYVYNRLISLNEVGGDPGSSGLALDAFHEFLRKRQKHNCHTLSATSTHDTKRAEDVRARINILSELPALWEEKLHQWADWNKAKKKLLNKRPVPDSNEEILLYQTMLGAWPLDKNEAPAFRKRLQDYMVKATREAMVHTKWTRPNVRHEQALLHFVKSITQESGDNRFLNDFLRACADLAFYGAINSLAQLVLKITGPGIPDFFQGSELWDLRLVDPDNRGPIDFEKRVNLLAELKRQEEHDRLALVADLLAHWQDGRIKLYVTSRALTFRRAQSGLFLDGSYLPLQAIGPQQQNVFAFMRHAKDVWAVTAVPRLATELVPAGRFPTGEKVWANNLLRLVKRAPTNWVNVLTGESLRSQAGTQGRELSLGEVLGKFPVALLRST